MSDTKIYIGTDSEPILQESYPLFDDLAGTGFTVSLDGDNIVLEHRTQLSASDEPFDDKRTINLTDLFMNLGISVIYTRQN